MAQPFSFAVFLAQFLDARPQRQRRLALWPKLVQATATAMVDGDEGEAAVMAEEAVALVKATEQDVVEADEALEKPLWPMAHIFV
jgi:hypothetical protein